MVSEPTAFDKAAAQWDDERRTARAQRLAKQILQYLKETETALPQASLLEFGCGTGLISFALAPAAQQFYGYDISQPMLERYAAKAKVFTPLFPGQNFKAVTQLDDVPGVDLIVICQVLHHIENARELIETLKGKLNPGGQLLVVDFPAGADFYHSTTDTEIHHEGFTRQQWENWCLEAGFASTDWRIIYQGTKTDPEGKEHKYELFLGVARAQSGENR
ncbi:hypothetical protein BSR29_07020 [Boudabousia liubingyangii]|uniref:Methyltransferase type 12 domain-containing protein n=1 Tax=Boudabousia liubingyangii TaxID=1921764 RepID=A0A1Q5PK23_9ACTO|nr:class I SAM-dependent methyltransferase [Boudabousia liubingyangii]OKL46569.1 hypothetical protein BSR29_07020 [Boudabousia liubingyangii]